MSESVYILGISAYYHDSAASLLRDGEIIAAAQEERFTRHKGDARFPHRAIDFCLRTAGIGIDRVDHIVFYENPVVKFERLMLSHLERAPGSLRSFLAAFPDWLTKKLWLQREIARELGVGKKRIEVMDHHMSHAASAFYPSPYEEAAILTVDGVGEWSTATYGIGRGNEIELIAELRFPHSVGLLYSAFTHYTGFKINSGEYKLMGLAPYGVPQFADVIKDKLIQINDDGSILLNQHYFNYVGGLTMTNSRFWDLFGGPPRKPESEIGQRIMDVAASVQRVVDDIVLVMGRHVHERTGMNHLTLAGGVALNVVSTGKLSEAGIFENLWTQPAAGDAGGSLGAALWWWHGKLGNPRNVESPDGMKGSLLGTEIRALDSKDDEKLEKAGGVWEILEDAPMAQRVAEEAASGKVVAIARGCMEFGPRALGNRSILGDARSPEMQRHMNQKIKFREDFRPFAPIVLAEDAHHYFDVRQESPYMLLVYPVTEKQRKSVPGEDEIVGLARLQLPRSEIPAVTHVDFSARVQTVDSTRFPFLHSVLSAFKTRTGCSVMINTSFNVRGEPIVNEAVDAYRCFMATDIDCVVIGSRFFYREKQKNPPFSPEERQEWLERFELD